VTPPAAEADQEVEETETITSSPEPSRTAGLFSKAFGLERDAAEAAASADPADASSATNDESVNVKRSKPEKRAENVSIAALTRRGMSRWELEKTLVSRELEPEVIEAELDRLESVGLVDDGALAETIVRTQHDRKGLGRGALTAELRRRHIDQEHIDAALEQVDDDDEQSRATELALKRASQLSSYDFETAKRRLTAFLMRKGYGSSVVRNAVDEALGGRSRSTSTVRFR
jgi:regulatory protein